MSLTADNGREKNVAPIEVDDGQPDNNDLHVETLQGSDALAAAHLKCPPKPFSKNMLILYLACLPGLMCGTMGGYDSSIIASFLVEGSFQRLFGAQVDGYQAGYITSLYQIGSVVAIPFIGESMDRFGRRFGIFIGCFLSIIGAIMEGGSAASGNLSVLLAGRFFVGFGTSIAQSAGPTYIVEICHPEYRGLLVGIEMGNLNLGGLLAAGVTYATMNMVGNRSWLIPTYVQIIFPGLACAMIYFFPESPRWLYTRGKRESAMKFLTKYHGEGDDQNPYVRLEIAEFEEQLDLAGADKRWWDYRVLFRTRAQRYRVFNSLFVGVFGALDNGGINYYIGAFFSTAGFNSANTVLLYNIWSNLESTLASYLGALIVDHVGRRIIMLLGLLGEGFCWLAMVVSTAMVAKNSSNAAAGKTGIAFFMIFCFAYDIITPVGVYNVEVLSFDQRAKGVAFQSFVSGCVALINQFATPVGLANIGWRYYIILMVWCFAEFVIAYLWMVESKGYTLEELNAIYESPNPRKASTQRRKVVVDADVNLLKVEEV